MAMHPSWLPPLVSIDPWTKDTYDTLYGMFNEDWLISKPVYSSRPVGIFPEAADGKELTFWHLTTKGIDQGARLPDFPRSARLRWIRAVVTNADQPEVLAWDYLEAHNRIKTYLWLKEADYLVVLLKHQDKHWLLTAFTVDFPHKRRELEEKYNKRIK